MSIKGIDVSKHQGEINWNAVAADNIGFAMIRAGYGMYDNQKDLYFDKNMVRAQAAGIPCGAYHYSYAKSVEEAKREAQVFLKWIKPYTFEYPVAFDIEDKSQDGFSRQLLTDIVNAFCGAVESAGYYTMVYANKNWLQNKLIYDQISQYDIWLAHYVTATDYDKPYGMWQYTSVGKVAGINGNCDVNISYRDYKNVISGGESNVQPPTPPQTTHVGVSTADSVAIRGGADIYYERVRNVNKGNEFVILEDMGNGWLKVNVAGLIGYILAEFVSCSTMTFSATVYPVAESTGDSVRVRSTAEIRSDNILRNVNKGNRFVVIGNPNNGWLKVNVAGTIGYISSPYVKIIS